MRKKYYQLRIDEEAKSAFDWQKKCLNTKSASETIRALKRELERNTNAKKPKWEFKI